MDLQVYCMESWTMHANVHAKNRDQASVDCDLINEIDRIILRYTMGYLVREEVRGFA
jgi:hypothetical protein